MFEKASWIENIDSTGEDTYTEFLIPVPKIGREVKLYVSCDGFFAAFKDKEVLPIAFSACADMPNYKLYDCFDLSGKLKKMTK